jgi:hypothetical protein
LFNVICWEGEFVMWVWKAVRFEVGEPRMSIVGDGGGGGGGANAGDDGALVGRVRQIMIVVLHVWSGRR